MQSLKLVRKILMLVKHKTDRTLLLHMLYLFQNLRLSQLLSPMSIRAGFRSQRTAIRVMNEKPTEACFESFSRKPSFDFWWGFLGLFLFSPVTDLNSPIYNWGLKNKQTYKTLIEGHGNYTGKVQSLSLCITNTKQMDHLSKTQGPGLNSCSYRNAYRANRGNFS